MPFLINKLPSKLMPLSKIIFRTSLLVGVICLTFVACTQPDSDTSQTSPPESKVLARNLARVAESSGALDIAWRQPKAMVKGAESEQFTRAISSTMFSAAQQYSRTESGLGLLVWHEGAIVVEDYRSGVSPEQHSATYSMHKSVLALVILAAIEDRFIDSLDSAIGQYIRQWSDDPRGNISFRQLLTHSSGLRSYSLAAQDPKALALVYSDQVSATALTTELEYRPGERFDYNNFNSQIAGIALEAALAANGTNYASYLSERIWQPIGAGDAALWIEKTGGSARYSSGLEATPDDWLRLGLLIMNQGAVNGRQVLLAKSIATLTTPSALNSNYGLHIWLGSPWQAKRSYGPSTSFEVPHSAPYLADDVIFFDGFGGQRVYVIPSRQVVIARTGDASFSWDDAKLVNLVLTELTDQAEALYRQRFDALSSGAPGVGLAAYSPLEEVRGASTPTVLPTWQDPDGIKEEPPLNSEVLQSLREWAEAANSSGLMIWLDGRLLDASYFGETTAKSLINSRSLAKPLSVVAIARAIEKGYIKSLDQSVAEFLPEWQGTKKATITLRHLLQMRSGLEAQRPPKGADDIMSRAYLHPYHAQLIIDEYPLVNKPGSRYDYANANSELIAVIIERATSIPYTDWVSREVFEPLGAEGGQVWVNRPRGVAHSGCCILLPMETWLRLAVLLLNDGEWQGRQLLPPGFVAQMRTPTEQNTHSGMGVYVAGSYLRYRGFANPDIEYGKSLHSEPYLAKDLFLFDGNGNQVGYIIPSHKLVILRTGSRPPKTITWDNSWLPNTVLRALADTTGVSLNPQINESE